MLALTDDAQTSQTIYGYSPFGEQTQVGENSANSLQYTGRENDNTGLYFYRARYFDPQLKRFITSDPIGLAGGLNTCAYVGGGPTNSRDPNGRCPWCIGAAIGGTIGGIYGAIHAGNTYGWNDWENILSGTLSGAAQGALVGAVPTEWGVWAATAVGALVSGGSDAVGQIIRKGNVCNWGSVAWNAGFGALGGWAGWNIGFGSALSGVADYGLSSAAAQNVGNALGTLVGGLPTLPPSPF